MLTRPGKPSLVVAEPEPEDADLHKRFQCHGCWTKFELPDLATVDEPQGGKGFRCPACLEAERKGAAA